MSLRLAWNILQIAAVADDDDAFVMSFEALSVRFDGTREAIIKVLEDDTDTKRMLDKGDLRLRLLPPLGQRSLTIKETP